MKLQVVHIIMNAFHKMFVMIMIIKELTSLCLYECMTSLVECDE